MSADPFTIMALMSAADGIVTGISAGKTGAANQKIHQHNAGIMRLRSQETIDAFAKRADIERDDRQQNLARNAQKYLKGNVEISGSSLLALQEEAADIEYGAQMVKHEGKLRGWELQQNAATEDYMGRMAYWRGQQQKRSAFTGAAFSLAGAAWSGYSKWGGGSSFGAGQAAGSHMYGMGGGGLRDSSGFIR